jgi:ferritin-like metal-binding protein YciE
MKIENLEQLLVHELRDLLSAERQITKALPKMAKAVSSEELQRAFEHHLEQTKEQITRLEEVFEYLGKSPRAKECVGMKGLLEEGSELMKEELAPDVMDAALISAAQKVEHYEMAAYGAARTYAHMLGYNEAADLLQRTLDEEGETNKKLTRLAESHINAEAADGQRKNGRKGG